MKAGLRRFLKGEGGVTSVEYGVIASLVALAVIVGVMAVGTRLGSIYGNVASKFPALPG